LRSGADVASFIRRQRRGALFMNRGGPQAGDQNPRLSRTRPPNQHAAFISSLCAGHPLRTADTAHSNAVAAERPQRGSLQTPGLGASLAADGAKADLTTARGCRPRGAQLHGARLPPPARPPALRPAEASPPPASASEGWRRRHHRCRREGAGWLPRPQAHRERCSRTAEFGTPSRGKQVRSGAPPGEQLHGLVCEGGPGQVKSPYTVATAWHADSEPPNREPDVWTQ
jgi:hypothetical protein